ncbi:MAG: glycosyltransferase [Candidatus Gracilibacteria bacterium]|nr:glycosyltransferase [Candidatus Gracilibacteria bacterium]
MKVAILHEMLVKLGGAEKVVEALLEAFPKADLFTLIYDEKKVGTVFPASKIKAVPKITQRIYNITKNQRFCLPYMARGVEQLDFSDYDVVIASSSGFSHGAITKPETKFIVYYHSPARYLWDWTNEYKKDIGFNSGIKGWILNKMFYKLRQWDTLASMRSDVNLANSENSANRVFKYYRKKADILFPPVETNRFKFIKKGDYYIIISALVEFKKIEVAIEAFNKMPDKKLKIIGRGSYKEALEKMVSGDNIEFLGAQYGDDLVKLLGESRGLVFPGEEDFGITPVEAMSAGKPVFAYKAGGLLETVIENKTGEFFEDKFGEDFVEKFIEFDEKVEQDFYNKGDLQKHAENFSREKFIEKIQNIVYKK